MGIKDPQRINVGNVKHMVPYIDYYRRDYAENMELVKFWESVASAKYKVGLKKHPDIIKAARKAAGPVFGSSASRLMTGSTGFHDALELFLGDVADNGVIKHSSCMDQTFKRLGPIDVCNKFSDGIMIADVTRARINRYTHIFQRRQMLLISFFGNAAAANQNKMTRPFCCQPLCGFKAEATKPTRDQVGGVRIKV